MSPSMLPNGHSSGTSNGTADGHFTNDLNLSILGLGVEYPPFRVGPEAVQTLAERFYPPSPAYVELSSTLFKFHCTQF
jgi:hypothetical protein